MRRSTASRMPCRRPAPRSRRASFPATASRCCRRLRFNTVDLSCEDGDRLVGGLGGLLPVSMLGALDAPVAHLALDDARVGAWAAFGERFGEDLGERAVMRGLQAVGGKSPGGRGCCGGRRGGFW